MTFQATINSFYKVSVSQTINRCKQDKNIKLNFKTIQKSARAINLKTEFSFFLFSLLHIAIQAMTLEKMRVWTGVLRTCLLIGEMRTKTTTMTMTILRKLPRQMVWRQNGWKLLTWVLPYFQCGFIFTTSLLCCCLLVNVDILDTHLFNLQKDLKSTWNTFCQPDTRIAVFCLEFKNPMWAENWSCVVWVCMLTSGWRGPQLILQSMPVITYFCCFPSLSNYAWQRVSLFSEIRTVWSAAM